MQISDVLELIKKGANISIDSRTIEKGDLFFAINRGVGFIETALSKGAIIAVSPSIDGQKQRQNIVYVQDVLEKLLEIGGRIKTDSPAKIVGITGSAGKTTTKVWLSEVLSKSHKVTAGIKNYNTIYGLPICLSKLKSDDDFGVFELGSNDSGEIKRLSQYLRPDFGIITNIMESHIGRFGSKKVLAIEKISIIDGIKSDGSVVFCGDSEYSEQISSKANEKGLKLISYGFGKKNDFVVEDYIKHFGDLRGHFDFIKTCVIATIHAFGLNISDYLGYMGDLKPLDGRGGIRRFIRGGKEFSIIDDSYNASPSTVIASLNFLKNMRGYNKKIAILGEMGELGEFSLQYHTQVAELLDKLDLDKVFFIGSSAMASPFIKRGITAFKEIDSEVIARILEIIDVDDIILLKGSNSVHLNKVVKFLEVMGGNEDS